MPNPEDEMPRPRLAHLPRAFQRHFTPRDDERLDELLTEYPRRPTREEWGDITERLARDFTPQQVMERWMDYLRPGLTRGPLTLEERRQALKAWFSISGDWRRVALQVGNGTERSAAQVKVVVDAMIHKLDRLQIELRGPQDVDALPDRFFTRMRLVSASRIREEFLSRRDALDAAN
jgi:hypothetical protein